MTAISTEEFDRRFDEGEDLEEYMDTDHVVVREAATHRLVITPPEWVVRKLDAEAERCGIPRKALINTILVEKGSKAQFGNEIKESSKGTERQRLSPPLVG